MFYIFIPYNTDKVDDFCGSFCVSLVWLFKIMNLDPSYLKFQKVIMLIVLLIKLICFYQEFLNSSHPFLIESLGGLLFMSMMLLILFMIGWMGQNFLFMKDTFFWYVMLGGVLNVLLMVLGILLGSYGVGNSNLLFYKGGVFFLVSVLIAYNFFIVVFFLGGFWGTASYFLSFLFLQSFYSYFFKFSSYGGGCLTSESLLSWVGFPISNKMIGVFVLLGIELVYLCFFICSTSHFVFFIMSLLLFLSMLTILVESSF